MGTKVRAAIYARLSRDAQGLSTSVADQERECRDEATRLGWDVVAVFADNDVPASEGERKRPRPAYGRLVKELQAGEFDAVLVRETQRLYRAPRDLEDLIDLAELGDVKIKAVQGGEVDLGSVEGRRYARVGVAMNKGEVETISYRVALKHESLARAGLWHGGPRPFGFKPVKVSPDSRKGPTTLEIVPEEAEAIRDAAGQILDGVGLRTVARGWNERGLRTPSRSRDGEGSRKPGGNEWSPKALKGTLTSPAVAGLREHRGEVIGKASWPPILDRRTLRRLVSEFEQRAESTVRPFRGRYLLSGFAVCGTCGEKMVGQPQRARPTYTCMADVEHPKGGRPRIMAEALERHILEAAERRPGAFTAIQDPGGNAELYDALDGIEERLAAFAAKAALAGMSVEEIRAGREGLAAERGRLEAKIAERSATIVTFVDEQGRNRASIDATAEARAKAEGPEDPRGLLERKVRRVVVRPSGRNKWIPITDRIEVHWREAQAVGAVG